MKTDTTKVVAQCTLENGNIIGLSDTNSQNEGFEAFRERFEQVTKEKSKNLQEFLKRINNL